MLQHKLAVYILANIEAYIVVHNEFEEAVVVVVFVSMI